MAMYDVVRSGMTSNARRRHEDQMYRVLEVLMENNGSAYMADVMEVMGPTASPDYNRQFSDIIDLLSSGFVTMSIEPRKLNITKRGIGHILKLRPELEPIAVAILL